jgi:hypothetical protein
MRKLALLGLGLLIAASMPIASATASDATSSEHDRASSARSPGVDGDSAANPAVVPLDDDAHRPIGARRERDRSRDAQRPPIGTLARPDTRSRRRANASTSRARSAAAARLATISVHAITTIRISGGERAGEERHLGAVPRK